MRSLLSSLYGRRWAHTLRSKREARAEYLQRIPEVLQRQRFRYGVSKGAGTESQASSLLHLGLSQLDLRTVLDAGLATFFLHVDARIASELAEGFYTIGPCGEETLGIVAMALRDSDCAALHYRHVATSLARSLRAGVPLEQLMMDRARGFTVSSLDPLTGGNHCCIGGPNDPLVTSTLASQAPPAVGRALGSKLAHMLPNVAPTYPKDMVSYVSVGDGSVNNAHFLAAVNLSEYAQHKKFKCPVVFGISCNDLCISLKLDGWTDKFLHQRLGMPVFLCDGKSTAEVFTATRDAVQHSRTRGGPSAVVFKGLPRRFGHAATDRQQAYLTDEQIQEAMDTDVLLQMCHAVVASGVLSWAEVAERMDFLQHLSEKSFDLAAEEPKVLSREHVCALAAQRASPPAPRPSVEPKGPAQVMRKLMTKVFEEQLQDHPDLVYIGEDVEHGGYYTVTEGLHRKFPMRVADFPPDETTLLAAGIGYFQAGLVPVVEIPYAKYLDCGADMFHEAATLNWLSAGQKPVGLVVRLQGFDKGLFGGNFHTHNAIHMPPGVDVVCFSNGADYVRGMRYAIRQARAGKIVMSVDCTALLNERHLQPGDNQWLCSFPAARDERGFDEVTTYGSGKEVVIVTYGNGVRTGLLAAHKLRAEGRSVSVVDCPLLSAVPSELWAAVAGAQRVVFADICKEFQAPLSGHAIAMQNAGHLVSGWKLVAASRTYNPLGSLVTFLNEEDILAACRS
mmetsp:Transcript_71883/g.191749  ORF Transcript_71883/g.191749 Transcript_71883/m.191749 type:complete len:733 (-) Transcript_71883:39-2237(-)